MEYEEYIKFFINNIKYFNFSKLDDFIYLSSLKVEDYANEENFVRVFNILSELDGYSSIYLYQDLDSLTALEEINDKRFGEISKLSEMCYSFLKYLDDEGCKHPIIELSKSTYLASESYDVLFSTFESMTSAARDDAFDDFFEEFDFVLNQRIFEDETDNLDLILTNYPNLDDKSLIYSLARTLQDTSIKKVQQTDSVDYRENGFFHYKLENFKNNDAVFLYNPCYKPFILAKLIEELSILKKTYGDIILDDYFGIDDEDDSAYDDNDGYPTIDMDGLNIIPTNSVSDSLDYEAEPSINNFVGFMLKAYNEYKKQEYYYCKSAQEISKRLQKCQDM